jgi:hypothetical protein
MTDSEEHRGGGQLLNGQLENGTKDEPPLRPWFTALVQGESFESLRYDRGYQTIQVNNLANHYCRHESSLGYVVYESRLVVSPCPPVNGLGN